MKIISLFLLPLLAMTAPPQRPEETPHLMLRRGGVAVTVLLPDARKGYYRSTRFDWSGLVARVELRGHTFYGPWKTTHDPGNFEDAVGTAEEFGTAGPDERSGPPGFVEARPGEPFLKIGVGLLEKPDEKPYQFFRAYRVKQPGTWTVRHGADWIEFRQELAGSGWGYRYTKRLALTGAGFTIERQLRNTGAREIDTDQYCHNFTMIDDAPVVPDYRVRFPFAVKADRSLDGFAEVSGKEIVFRKPLQPGPGEPGRSVYAELAGFGPRAADNEFTVENVRTGAAVRVRGDRPLSRFDFFAAPLAVCPEPFIQLRPKPGEEARWRTEYTFQVRLGQ